MSNTYKFPQLALLQQNRSAAVMNAMMMKGKLKMNVVHVQVQSFFSCTQMLHMQTNSYVLLILSVCAYVHIWLCMLCEPEGRVKHTSHNQNYM